MTQPHDFPHHIDHATSYINAAIDQLNHALTMPEAHLLEPKHRRLLRNTRHNLRRYKHILTKLTTLAHNAITRQYALCRPLIPTSPQHPTQANTHE